MGEEMVINNKNDYEEFIKNMVKNKPKMSKTDYEKMKNICRTNYTMLGYPTGFMRSTAKEIFKSGYRTYLDNCQNKYYEEVMIKGFIIGHIRNKKECIAEIKKFVPLIDSWAINDSFITDFYTLKKETTREDFELFCEYAKDEKEFFARFGIMMIFRYCLNVEYLDEIFDLVKGITNHAYYVDMAISWLLCECMIKYPEPTYELLSKKVFSKFIQNKAISKCHDSFRIPIEVKENLKNFRIE